MFCTVAGGKVIPGAGLPVGSNPQEVWQVLGKTTFRDFILGTPYEDILGRYVVNSAKIGSGRYGVIRKCIDARTKQAYACKTIRKDRIEVRSSKSVRSRSTTL